MAKAAPGQRLTLTRYPRIFRKRRRNQFLMVLPLALKVCEHDQRVQLARWP